MSRDTLNFRFEPTDSSPSVTEIVTLTNAVGGGGLMFGTLLDGVVIHCIYYKHDDEVIIDVSLISVGRLWPITLFYF